MPTCLPLGLSGIILGFSMNSSGLVDSHLHLQDFGAGIDPGEVVARAVDAGVTHFVCNGTSEHDWETVLELSKTHPEVVPCFGLHPWFVADRSERWLDTLESYVRDTPCAVGEIGLDRLVEPFDKEAQEEVFRAQIELARKYERPMMVHCVKMWGVLMEILNTQPKLPGGLLLHAYGGSVDLIKPLVKLGAYFSFSGTVLLENHRHAREALKMVPAERLLIESDAPNMLPPEEFRTFTVNSADGTVLNHPANLPEILKGVAELRGESTEELKSILWENAKRLIRGLGVGS